MLVTGVIACGVIFYLFSLFGRTQEMIEDTNAGRNTTGRTGELAGGEGWDQGSTAYGTASGALDRATPAPVTTPPVPTPVYQGHVEPSQPESPAPRRIYAIGLHELGGLSQGSAPGTPLELWVTWSRPITRTPRVQRLLRDVILEKIVPPVVPEGPITAVLSLPHKDIPDLIFGDRYGELSAIAAR